VFWHFGILASRPSDRTLKQMAGNISTFFERRYAYLGVLPGKVGFGLGSSEVRHANAA
jgi:hypothetical protein